MRTWMVAIIAFFLMPSVSLQAQSYKPCETIITKGLREFHVQSSSQSNLKRIYENYCAATSLKTNVRASVGLDLVVDVIPVGFKGAYGSSEDAMRNFCKTYASEAQSYSSDFTYEETIIAKAYDSFNQCVRFVAQGVSAEHEIVSLGATGFFFWAGVSKPVKISGVTTSDNITCSGLYQGKLINFKDDTEVTTNDTLGFNCKRTFRREGTKQVFDEGTIQIVTNFGNYNVFLPRDERLPEDTATIIVTRLSKLEAQVAKRGSDFEEFMATQNSNIQGIKQKFEAIDKDLSGKAKKGDFSLKVEGLDTCIAVLNHSIQGTGSWWPLVMAPCGGGYQKWRTE